MFDNMIAIEFLQTLYVRLLYCQQYETNMINLNKASDLLKRFGVFHRSQRKSHRRRAEVDLWMGGGQKVLEI